MLLSRPHTYTSSDPAGQVLPPHTLGPEPPHISPVGQVPQLSTSPQPSVAMPQL